MSKSNKTIIELITDGELQALIEKAELNPKRSVIRLFFKRSVNKFARRFFVANLKRVLQANTTPVPRITPTNSKEAEDTSQAPYHLVTELWVGLVDHHALSRCYPLWRHPSEIPSRQFLLSFAKDVDDFLRRIEIIWSHKTRPSLRET